VGAADLLRRAKTPHIASVSRSTQERACGGRQLLVGVIAGREEMSVRYPRSSRLPS